MAKIYVHDLKQVNEIKALLYAKHIGSDIHVTQAGQYYQMSVPQAEQEQLEAMLTKVNGQLTPKQLASL